jgi:hypothetical protein
MPTSTVNQQERSAHTMESGSEEGRIKAVCRALIVLVLDILEQME